METSPVPSPAATMEPGSGICPLQHSRVCAGVGRNCRACNGTACPQLSAFVCWGWWGAPFSQKSLQSQGTGETGRLRTHGLPAAGRLGRSPALVSGGTGSAARSRWRAVCLSVCHRAWSGAPMGCQAFPLHAPRGLLVLEGKVWPFPWVSERRLASLRNKLLLKALASKELCSTKLSAERLGDPVPLHAEDSGMASGLWECTGTLRGVWLASLSGPANLPGASLQSPKVVHGERPKQGGGLF